MTHPYQLISTLSHFGLQLISTLSQFGLKIHPPYFREQDQPLSKEKLQHVRHYGKPSSLPPPPAPFAPLGK